MFEVVNLEEIKGTQEYIEKYFPIVKKGYTVSNAWEAVCDQSKDLGSIYDPFIGYNDSVGWFVLSV